jgi:hypothetical protein
MKKWALRLAIGSTCAALATMTVLWFVPPPPRITLENIGKVHPDMTEDEAIELFGRPAFREARPDGGRDVRWIEDTVLFGVHIHEDGKVAGIRWEKDREPEGFWTKLRRRLRL